MPLLRYGEAAFWGTKPRWRAKLAYTRATQSARTLPNFLIVGAPQCGTSSFFSYLIAHPGFLPALVKEIRYFDEYYDRGLEWYRSFFPLRASSARVRRRLGLEPAIGEATPTYLSHPLAPARVRALDPEMRLIALLRDPVERTYSEFTKRWRRNVGVSLEQALDLESERIAGELERMRDEPTYFSIPYRRYAYLARSRYAEQLERWLELFPREQLLVLTTEQLAQDPGRTVGEAARFLKLPERSPAGAAYTRKNTRSYEPLEPAMRERLTEYFVEPNRRLYELLGRDLGWQRPSQHGVAS
jgi:sulfotransferase family protein